MSTGAEQGDDEQARALAGLAHALARTARRSEALGRRVHGKRATHSPQAAPARQPVGSVPISSAGHAPSSVEHVQRRSPRQDAPEVAHPPLRAVLTAQAGKPARTAADVREQAASAASLDELRARVSACEACSLCKTRTQTVFQDGSAGRGVLFVGEAPGADEDRTGVPFVGRSGQLLTDIITKGMGLARAEVAIANVLKCRPPENRDPTPQEKAICTPWLDRQIELLDPRVVIPLGRHAAMHVLRVEAAMGDLRQRVYDRGGRKIVPTFHPSYLLRSPGQKKECWKDIQLAMGVLGLKPGKPPGEAR